MITSTYRPLDAATLADPHRAFAELLADAPVAWHEQLEAWVVVRHHDCQEVLRNSGVFARDPRRVGRTMAESRRNIQTQDPPDQAELRRLVMRALHEQDLTGIARRGRERLAAAIDRHRGAGPFDLMPLAAEAALDVINEVVGALHYTVDTYKPIFIGLTRAMDSGIDPSRLPAGRAAGEELSEAVQDWFSSPDPEGMIARLAESTRRLGIADHLVRNTVGGVFNAGFSTLYALTGSLTQLLLERRDLLEGMSRGPSETAVHELLRYLSPAQATSRYAVVDTEIGGIRISAGSTVVTLLAAANRDPAVFDRPAELVLDRSPNPHLAFAWGPHVCLGAQLALSWVSEVVALLEELGASFRLAGEPTLMDTATLRNLTALPVQFDEENDR